MQSLPNINTKQKNIFVLRNNDLGDVLVSTPLIFGLKKSFPNARVLIGVGEWSIPLLQNNPNIDEIIPCNAPWHNKQICRFPANSPKTFLEGLIYSLLSKEARYISKQKFTHGIDVLGSRQGAWLMLRSGIQNRFGVKGYAGGEGWCHKTLSYDENKNVSEARLGFLRLFNVNKKFENRPQIYLTTNEKNHGDSMWDSANYSHKRIVIAPGGGFPEKCWGDENFTILTKKLLQHRNFNLSVIGSIEDKKRIQVHQSNKIKNFCGEFNLRQSAALVSSANYVITNTSLSMHLAGAFKIPSVTLLGEWYDSAKLHHTQWGYPEGIVLGKERSLKMNSLASPEEAYQCIIKSLQVHRV